MLVLRRARSQGALPGDVHIRHALVGVAAQAAADIGAAQEVELNAGAGRGNRQRWASGSAPSRRPHQTAV